MDFNEKIRTLRQKNGITMGELAKMINVSTPTIQRYESGEIKNVRRDKIAKLAKALNVTPSYLMGWTDESSNQQRYRRINVYASVPAGISIEALDNIVDWEDISFECGFDFNKDYMGIVVKGDSMYPKYMDQDIIIIEITPNYESGTDAVVYVNGYDATLKKIIKNENGTITLKPINPTYPPTTYGVGDETISILGIVREIRRKV